MPRLRAFPNSDPAPGLQLDVPVSREMKPFKRVVVYRIGSLGDTLVVLPAFHLVRRAFPDAHITLRFYREYAGAGHQLPRTDGHGRHVPRAIRHRETGEGAFWRSLRMRPDFTRNIITRTTSISSSSVRADEGLNISAA